MYHVSSHYHHFPLLIFMCLWYCHPSSPAVITLCPLSDALLIIIHLHCHCYAIYISAFQFSCHIYHCNYTTRIDINESILHPYKYRDTSFCTPLLLPTIFVPRSPFYDSDMPHSSSDLIIFTLICSASIYLCSTLLSDPLRSSYYFAPTLFSISKTAITPPLQSNPLRYTSAILHLINLSSCLIHPPLQ